VCPGASAPGWYDGRPWRQRNLGKHRSKPAIEKRDVQATDLGTIQADAGIGTRTYRFYRVQAVDPLTL